MKDLDSYLGEAIDNIREDRGKAKEFLEQLEEAVSESDDTYKAKMKASPIRIKMNCLI